MSMQEYYPAIIRSLPEFEGQFEAYKLSADSCDVLFASYPAGTRIDAHTHDTENVGIITKGELLLTMDGKTEKIGVGQWYRVPSGKEHAAEFKEETAEIELWFRT